jgi:exodeoxyribonuclease VII large subunit
MNTSLRLSEFCRLIGDTLSNAFQDRAWWILAEIRERNDKGDYTYFELVEKSENGTEIIARTNASVWRKEAILAFRNFEDITGKRAEKGMQVMLKAGVTYHPVYGLSLQLFDIDSQHTLGQLELQRRQTIQLLATKPDIRLVDGNLITPNKKLRLAPVVQRIALITSASAAGFQDFMHTIEQNEFGYRFICTPYFSILQGENAAAQMKDQLLKIYADQPAKNFDAIIMIRGGGAQSDLLPFDDFNLAHTVARIPVPVITGIGHLKNESIVDLVAYQTTKTPTEAANFLIQHNRDFEELILSQGDLIAQKATNMIIKQQRKLDHFGMILNNGTMQVINAAENRLTRMRERLHTGVVYQISNQSKKLDEEAKRLPKFVRAFMQKQDQQLTLLNTKITMLNPISILKRGYALIIKEGKTILSASQLTPGDEIEIVMHDGKLKSKIEK